MRLQGKTTQGIKFDVITINDEIVYIDENNETLTWDYNSRNAKLVLNMVRELETRSV